MNKNFNLAQLGTDINDNDNLNLKSLQSFDYDQD